jgi:hypothetical protein
MRDSLPKYRINFASDESKRKYQLTAKCRLPEAVEIEVFEMSENAKLNMTRNCD